MKTANKKTKKPAAPVNMSLPIGQLLDAAYNPRKKFIQDELEEMAGTMRERGVLEPLLVRPIGDGNGKKPSWEIISGHKRARAARLAELKCVPCLVHDVDDQEARAMAIIANIHSNPTPLEQGAAYRELIEVSGLSLQAAADYLGESVHAIRALVALKNLPPLAEEAVKKKILPIATAGLIAGIPSAPQRERLTLQVLTGVVHGEPNPDDLENEYDPLTHVETKELISKQYQRQLKGCAWDLKDKNLVPEAGPCTTCPKRVGNLAKADPDAYAGQRADMCLDTACYASKAAVCRARAIAAADAAGIKTLTGYLASQVGLFNSAYLFLDHENKSLPFALPNATTLREFLADMKIELAGVMLAVNDDGLSREIVNASWAVRMLAPKAPSPAPPSPSNGKSKPRQVPAPYHPDDLRQPAKSPEEPAAELRPKLAATRAVGDAASERAIPDVLAAVRSRFSAGLSYGPAVEALRALALAVIDWHMSNFKDDWLVDLEAARSIEGVGSHLNDESLAPWAAWIAAADPAELVVLLVEVQVRAALDGLPERRACRELLKLAELDRDTLIVAARAEEKAGASER